MKKLDPNTLPQVLPPDAEPWQRLLWDAAGEMQRRGKADWWFEDPEGHVCIKGALKRAAGYQGWDVLPPFDNPTYGAAVKKFDGYISMCAGDFCRANDTATIAATMRACALRG